MKKTIGILLAMAMILSLSISAFAQSGDVTVKGHIGTLGDPNIGPDGTYDITYNTAVHWWVTQANPTTVVNGDSNGPDATVVNRIQNNNTATRIAVSLDSFNLKAGDAEDTTMQGYLTLNLTGDLAEGAMAATDISTGYTGPFNYTATLDGGSENAWKYGFGGTYNAPVLTTSYAPQYTMTLGFTFV